MALLPLILFIFTHFLSNFHAKMHRRRPPLLVPLFLLAIFACQLAESLGTVQSASVKGILMCKGKASVGTKVKLYDQDTLDPDDLMDEGVTDEDGAFQLQGHESEITDIDPKVNVYHDCNDENIPCLQKFSVKIPKDYITQNSEEPKKTFDIGTINLEGKFSGQSRDCIN